MKQREYEVRIENWDNKRATEALSKAPRGQRDVDPLMVGMFADLWKRDLWDPTIGAPMCFMDDGTFGNGNHRSTFISRLPNGVTVPVLVAYAVPMEMLPYMDGGKNRTLGHHLHYAFPDMSTSVCRTAASITTIAMTYRGPKILPRVDVKPDPHLAVSWAVTHGEGLMYAAKNARRIVCLESGQTGAIMSARTLGFVLYMLRDEPNAVRFFEEWATRLPLGPTDPRHLATKHYARKEFQFTKGAQGREATLRRIAEMFSVWDAFQREVRWTPWNGKAEAFRHPITEHGKAA